MSTKAMRRAERSARTVIHGQELLAQITSPRIRKQLVEAVKSGIPPVTAVSGLMIEIARKDAKALPVRSFAGLCVRAALDEEGFEVDQTGVRLPNDPVFRTGSTYAAKGTERPATDILKRLVQMLTHQEVQQLTKLLKARRGQ